MGSGKANNMKNSKLLWIIAGIILMILIWGLIGSSKAAEMGITCDFGIGQDGSALCWKWHTNALGDISNKIGEILNK